jgi:hypothetical protein
MDSIPSVLTTSIQDLEDAVSDFYNVSFHAVESELKRLIFILDEKPLADFLVSVLPEPDVQTWCEETQRNLAIVWPRERKPRVAMQIALCRAMSVQEIRFFDFVHQYYQPGSQISDHILIFAKSVLAPLVRDISRLIEESRSIPPILSEAMGNLPKSDESTLDNLLDEACTLFRDPAPKAREEATKMLWDAWERLKTIDDIKGDKKRSLKTRLEKASPDTEFRNVLYNEGKNLTDIGNNFHIRHFETNKTPITQPEHFDYLFHRLYALIHLLLIDRQRTEEDA